MFIPWIGRYGGWSREYTGWSGKYTVWETGLPDAYYLNIFSGPGAELRER
jgi:hypothetical protein